MIRRRLIAGTLAIAVIGAVALIYEKYFVFAFLRMTEGLSPANGPAHHPPSGPMRDPLIIDFSASKGSASHATDALDKAASTLEERKPHTVQVLGLKSRPLTFKSQGTLVDYRNGSVDFLTAYLVPNAVSYRDAVQSIAGVIKTLGLEEELDLEPYGPSLESIPDPEPYIPRAGWRPFDLGALLNCGWSRTQKAILEIDTVSCRPYLFVDRAVANDAN